jgi:hypothetical protein
MIKYVFNGVICKVIDNASLPPSFFTINATLLTAFELRVSFKGLTLMIGPA